MAALTTTAGAIVAPRASSRARAVRDASSRASAIPPARTLAPLRRPGRSAAAPIWSPRPVRTVARASGDGEGSLLDELDADARCPVPQDQRPASQFKELQGSPLLGWGGLDLPGYLARLGFLGAFFFVVLAYPIASVSYDPRTQPLEAIICATTGTCVATAAISLLIYNNWSYVRDRLLSATVEYEETGWYDGQVYVKDPEMLARDRLLGTYTVRPIVERLRKTLLACGAGVFVSLAALNSIDAPEYGVDRPAWERNGGAGFFSERSAAMYEPSAMSEEEEAEEEAAAWDRYEAAMDRYKRDNDAARAAKFAEVFVGRYSDPKHPGCAREIAAGSSGATLTVRGADGTPGCSNGEEQREWSLEGEVRGEGEILIDFSPKGGPKDLLGKWTGKGILYPDGNTWSKLE